MSEHDDPLDMRFVDIYDSTEQHDEDALEMLCPVFLELCQVTARYSDEELLGRGGLKEVFSVYDFQADRRVALARLRDDRDLQYYDLFIREARLVASLKHPNIIKVYDIGVDEKKRPYFTMALKGKTNLAAYLKSDSPPARAERLDIFLKVCDAMAYAHTQGVIHLDLKPDNIQCDDFRQVIVCDWGLGTFSSQPIAEDTPTLRSVEHTLMGQVQGTLGYMAPEQVTKGQAKDPRTDVYALGCILHTLLCGEPPLTGSMSEVLHATVHTGVRPFRDRLPKKNIPESLEAVVLKATALDPAQRYDSVSALQQDVRNYLGGYSTVAEESGFFKEARLFLMRNRIPSAVTGLAVIIMTVLTVLFVQRIGRAELATAEEQLRSRELLVEVDMLSADYQALFEHSALSKQQLAQQLVLAAKELKKRAMDQDPLMMERQVRALLAKALAVDPECNLARWEQFKLNCMVLDYKAALADPVIPLKYGRSSANYMKLARTFSTYHFDAENRPSSEQVVAVFHQAQQFDGQLNREMEQVYIYHRATQKGPTGQVNELEALLAVYNAGDFSMAYAWNLAELEIRSDQGPLVLTAVSGHLERSPLRFLPIHSLIINTTGPFSLLELQQLTMQRLDLSKCGAIQYPKRVTLPQLKTLYIRRDPIQRHRLQKVIRWGQRVNIIEVD